MGLEQTRRPPAPRELLEAQDERPFVDDVDPASREPAEGEDFERQRWLHGHLAEG